ncbi:MAG: acyl carrier protein [Myxococcales bacterium]|nr:acyl carrier protein [Myxococcales bacterium]
MVSEQTTEHELAAEVAAMVRAHLPADASAALNPELDLRTSGLLDSFALLELVAALEGRFKCEFSIDALAPGSLRSVAGLTRLVLTTLRGAGEGPTP